MTQKADHHRTRDAVLRRARNVAMRCTVPETLQRVARWCVTAHLSLAGLGGTPARLASGFRRLLLLADRHARRPPVGARLARSPKAPTQSQRANRAATVRVDEAPQRPVLRCNVPFIERGRGMSRNGSKQ